MSPLAEFPPLHEIAARVRDGRSPAAAFATLAHERLATHGAALGALISLPDRGAVVAAAERVATRVAAGERLPLAGVPIALKDNLCTRGWTTTCASALLAEFRPPYDATVVRRLEGAGAILVAKTNMDEFAMGSSTENSAYGTVANPWDLTRTPGGSSGGSAAVVAARLVPCALGSDTGGSIRQPAAFTGVVGLKPTYGRVSRYGLVAFGSSLDVVGPLCTSVADAMAILAVIAGDDPADATSVKVPVPDWGSQRELGVEGLRVGLPEEYFDDGIDAAVRARVTEAAARLETAGATLVPISLPHTRYAIPTYYVVAACEASSNLARYTGIHYGRRGSNPRSLASAYTSGRQEGLGSEVVRRIMLGTFCLSSGYYEAYYDQAMRARTLLRRDFDDAFERIDVILSPTTPTPAFRLGTRLSDPLQMYLADALTVAANLAGHPALVVPGGFVDHEGTRLPVGIQLTAPHFDEAVLFRAAHGLEASLPAPDAARRPPFPKDAS